MMSTQRYLATVTDATGRIESFYWVSPDLEAVQNESTPKVAATAAMPAPAEQVALAATAGR